MGKRHRGVAVMKRRRDRVEERANSEGRNMGKQTQYVRVRCGKRRAN